MKQSPVLPATRHTPVYFDQSETQEDNIFRHYADIQQGHSKYHGYKYIGKEEVVYGAAIQIFNCLKTGGEMLEGGLEEVIDTFRHTFLHVATSKVTFSLKNPLSQERMMIQDHLKPQPKPGGRHVESRTKMVSSWERSTMKAIRVKEKLLLRVLSAKPKTA